MKAYQCPFCGLSLAVSADTCANYFLTFNDVTKFKNNASAWKRDNLTCLQTVFVKCPSCKKTSIHAFGYSKDLDGLTVSIYPRTNYVRHPAYVPKVIISDYQEACSLIEVSERSAALLARRCLRAIIRDYWGISHPTLYEEIMALENRINEEVWQAVQVILHTGGIGQRLQEDVDLLQDVDPSEAHRLIKLVELWLKEWYIARHNREELLSEITSLAPGDIP
jgi:hypothetical protein